MNRSRDGEADEHAISYIGNGFERFKYPRACRELGLTLIFDHVGG